jgi:hypothetical protein
MLQSHRKTCILILLLAGTMAGQHAPGDFDRLVVRQLALSRVKEHLFHLTDAVGPRVVGSPALETARLWLEARLKSMAFKPSGEKRIHPCRSRPGSLGIRKAGRGRVSSRNSRAPGPRR